MRIIQQRVPAGANVIVEGGPYDGWRLAVDVDVLQLPIRLNGEEHIYSFRQAYRQLDGRDFAIFGHQGVRPVPVQPSSTV